MTKLFSAQCPTRIDLAGGTCDLWPIYNCLDNPCTINAGINLYAKAELKTTSGDQYAFSLKHSGLKWQGRYQEIFKDTNFNMLAWAVKLFWNNPGKGLTIEIDSQAPQGSGLGGSSAAALALLACLKACLDNEDNAGCSPSPLQSLDLLEAVTTLESRILFGPAGVQDHFSSYGGGLGYIRFAGGKPQRHQYPQNLLRAWQDRLIIIDTGRSRNSGMNNWQVYKKFFDGEKTIVAGFNKITQLTNTLHESIQSENYPQAIECIKEEWAVRSTLWPHIITSEFNRIEQQLQALNVSVCRFCGAGGGGVMIAFCEPEERSAVISKLRDQKINVLRAELVQTGLEIKA